jgi:hypothetical protein
MKRQDNARTTKIEDEDAGRQGYRVQEFGVNKNRDR